MQQVEKQEIVKHIHNWIDYVAETETNNGWVICPHAKKVLINDRLKIFYYDKNKISNFVENFNNEKKKFKVWIFVCDDVDIKIECEILNNLYHNIVWLPDYAKNSGTIGETETGNKKYNLILMQDKKELNQIGEKLSLAGYYSNWTKEYYKEIVESRFNG